MSDRTRIPAHGRDHQDILEQMRASRDEDARWKEGRTWSLIYYVDEHHQDLLREAWGMFLAENYLNPMAFQSLRTMESQVVEMTAELLHGPASTVGTITSGGTESILLALKSWRDRARATRPWVRRPNVVLPASAHPAFDKGAHLFGLRLKKVPVGPDFRAQPARMARAVDRNTILMVASAPQYPQGVIDPVQDIAAIARDKRLPLHVDACFGGFILPWLERLGRPIPPWDFRVDGVSSISADVHKYGYAPKGASVLLHRSMDSLKHQFFVTTDWSGGIYASSTIPGSRPGGAVAAAWASMMALGEEGYLSLAEGAWRAAEALRAGVAELDGLRVLAEGDATVVPIGGEDGVNIYAVADRLQAAGWAVDRQHRPPCLHLSTNAANLPVVQPWLEDARQAVAHVRAHPEERSAEAAMYGMMARLPARGLVRKGVIDVLSAMYAPGASEAAVGAQGGLIERYGARIDAALERWEAWRQRR